MVNEAESNGLYIGTSGWSYRHWSEIFYPKDMKPDKYLEYYITKFTCVWEMAPEYIPICEASASVDMMEAVIELCTSPLVLAKPDGNLYLSGYSQGAHAALATQLELEANPLPGLNTY